MIKVLIVGFTDNLGGIENVIMNYYRKINKTKIQFNFLYSTNTIALKDEIESLGGKVYHIAPKHSNFFKYKKDIKLFFKNHAKEYDAIWVNFCNITNLDYFKLAKKYDIKKRIIHAHNSQNMGSFLKLIIHIINRKLIKLYATDFWSCSQVASNWFYSDKIINSSKHRIVNNAIDYDKFKYNENIRNDIRKKLKLEDYVVFGNVGRFHFQKNHSFALRVFCKFLKLNPKSVFLLIGSGEENDNIKQIVKELNIEDKVKFLGVRNDVNELLQAMDIFLFPSLFEGLSLSLIEAQASGVLVFTSDNVSIETRMSDNIYFWNLNDEGKWASKIFKIYKKYDRKKAKNRIRENNFDIQTEVKKIENIFLKKEIK